MTVASTQLLLDTNILVHIFRGRTAAAVLEKKYQFGQRSPRPAISVVSKGEILSLALQFGWGTDKVTRVEDTLARMPTVDISSRVVHDAYARLDHASTTQGITMGKNDLWIAASALVVDATLLTMDDDFGHLVPQGLRLERVQEAALRSEP